MFFAAHSDGSYSPLELSGIKESPAVKALQKSLGQLAMRLRRPTADPGPINGIMSERTMVSIAGLLDKITPNLPSWTVQPIHSALMLGVSSTEARNVAGRYVTELRFATDKATDFAAQLPTMPPIQTSLGIPFFTPGWYTQTSKLAIVGGLFLIGIWLFTRGRHRR